MKISWKDYISSNYWKRFSKKALAESDVACSVCGRKKYSEYKVNTKKKKKGDLKKDLVLTLHHTNYENLGCGCDSVIPMCRAEHDLIHTIERMRGINSLWEKVYQMILENTPWKYTPAKDLEVPDNFNEKKVKVKKTKLKK